MAVMLDTSIVVKCLPLCFWSLSSYLGSEELYCTGRVIELGKPNWLEATYIVSVYRISQYLPV